jgi:FkbM family methyltransferase
VDLILASIRLRKLAAIIAHPLYFGAFFRYGVAPAVEHEAVLRNLDFDCVIDVGANRGQFSLICRQIKPRARIIAFEPLGEPADIYRAVFSRDERVRLHNVALAPAPGKMQMNVSRRDDSSSLLPISSFQTENFPGTELAEVRAVVAGPMADFVRPADLSSRNLLKIDVQGFELEVLKSAEALLPRFHWIYVECSYRTLYFGQALAEQVVAWLTERGFEFRAHFNPTYVRSGGELLQADILFETRQRADAALARNHR